ncbi:ABC transporter substrate-binding protein [Salinarchaeum laminariae]|uniref:ABC transporter substrate-binding protein n=1 Tax=Salinarchaeum laminariae TaxID=869888 RepID=UPI0020C15104|nr:ABC transporter substrate-binding protein [Salinarchaeum laminariae]
MTNDNSDTNGLAPTRRQYLTGTVAVSGGLLAGCAGYTPGGSEGGDGSYSASISPVGEVQFDRVPEEVFTVFPQYADMAVALGHGDAINAVYVPEMSGTTMNHYYTHLDGVSFEWEDLTDPLSSGLDKEQIYSLDSDLHLTDPAWAANQNNWDRSDTEEIADTVAPWFGNFYSGTHDSPGNGWANDYEFYDLWELFGNVAEVFDATDRYEALAEIHADLVASIQAELPPVEERPTAVRATLAADGSSFYTYHLNEPGYWLADTRPLGANDAFADADWDGLWGTVGYETMLEADPDVFLHLWGLTPNYSMADTRSTLENHDAGSQLTAVETDRVYPAGMRYHGPIMNLFQIEMGAKQLYPELFGEWPDYEDGEHYPDIPAEEQLFDREQVAAIVNGEY